MSRHLSVGHGVRRLLELQDLEVHALALVRQNEERVQGALGPAGLLGVALPWHGVPIEAGLDCQVGYGGAAGPALDGDARRLGLDAAGRHHDAGDLHQAGDLVTLEVADVGAGLVAPQGHVNVFQQVVFATGPGHLYKKVDISNFFG